MPPNTQPVCDNCRLRKTKCDRASPCSTCVSCDLPCFYRHNLQRRGPKGGKGRRLNLIKQGIPKAEGLEDYGADPTTPFGLDARSLSHLDISAVGPLSGASPSPLPSPGVSPSIQSTLADHVEIFMAHLFPVMPVVDEMQLRSDSLTPDSLSPSRYALLLALAAVTRIQLLLDQEPENMHHTIGQQFNISPGCGATGVQFLAAAETARQQINIAESMSEDAILTSFFLFVCYGNLEKHNQAWFYLNQSVSLAILLEIDNETPESVAGLSDLDIDRRRRIFWLLFISERTYALQRRRPVLFRRTVPKPEVFYSQYPIIMDDFVNHVSMFESLPPALYDWQPGTTNGTNIGSLSRKIIQAVSAVQPQNSLLESQQFDTLITQHWLRVVMWKLGRGISPNTIYNTEWPSNSLPFDAGRSIMSSLTTVSTASKNRHGISIEQKLFDIGMSLIDVAPSTVVEAIALGPQDLLGAIFGTLTCIRGRESHFLPKLLQYSEERIGLTRLGWGKDMQLSLLPFNSESEQGRCEELPATDLLETLDSHAANDIIYEEFDMDKSVPIFMDDNSDAQSLATLYSQNTAW